MIEGLTHIDVQSAVSFGVSTNPYQKERESGGHFMYLKNPEMRKALQDIVAHEESLVKEFKDDPYLDGTEPWWEWAEVPVDWRIVHKLLLAKIVKKQGKKYYILKDRKATKRDLARTVKQKRKRKKKLSAVASGKIPTDLFDVIEGFNDIKAFIGIVLRADEPVHILLEGSPGTAKSLFLMEIERLGATFITAGTATKVGIRDIIFDDLPEILIIDEIEKVGSSGDLSSLLTWMESGRIIITKHGLKEERHGKGIVFAACNTVKRLPPELLDRFQHFKIKPYTPDQFVRVVTNYLHKRKKVKKRLAKYIATQVEDYSISVREAIRISRLAKTNLEADAIIKTIRRYS